MFITGQTTNSGFQKGLSEIIADRTLKTTDLDKSEKVRNFVITYNKYGDLVNTYENEGKEGFDPSKPGKPIEYKNMGVDVTMDPEAEGYVAYDYYRFTKVIPYQASPEYLRDALRAIKGSELTLGDEEHIEAYNNEFITDPIKEDDVIKAGKYSDTDSVQLNSDFSQINLATLARLNTKNGDVESGAKEIEKADIQVIVTLKGTPVKVDEAKLGNVEGVITDEYVDFKGVEKGTATLTIKSGKIEKEILVEIKQDRSVIVELD